MGKTTPDPEVQNPEPAAADPRPLGEAVQFIDALKQSLDLKLSNTVLVVDDSKRVRQMVCKSILKAMPPVRIVEKDYEAKGQRQGTPLIVLSASAGKTGSVFSRRSIRSRQCDYSPMVAVAKAACANPKMHDAIGDKGLVGWIEFFLREQP